MRLGLGLGVMNCGQAFCDPIRIAGSGQIALSYRRHWYALGLAVSGGGSEFARDATDLGRAGAITFMNVAAQALVFPMPAGRLDPYLGAGFGFDYTKLQDFFDEEPASIKTVLKRPSARAILGVHVFASKHFGLGPRFDLALPFGGRVCTSEEGDPFVCESAAQASGSALEFDQRSFSRGLPKTWTLTLQVLATF